MPTVGCRAEDVVSAQGWEHVVKSSFKWSVLVAVTPTAAATRSTQKLGALTLVLDHSAQPPATAVAALQGYDEFERSVNNLMATNVEDANLAKRGAPAAIKQFRDVARDQKAKAEHAGGLITVATKVDRVNEAVALLTGCYDQSKSVLVRSNGTTYVGALTKQYPRMQLRVVVSNVASRWMVTEYDLKATKC